MATVTHVCTLDYVAKMLGEDPELLEAIVYNDDNLSYGSIISVYTGPEDTITALCGFHEVPDSNYCQRRSKSRPRRRSKTRPVGEDVRHGERASHIACACHGALARQGQ